MKFYVCHRFRAYEKRVINLLLFIYYSVKILDREALGLSNIVKRLFSIFSLRFVDVLPSNLLKSFVEQLVLLTCSFAEGAASEETVSFILVY